MLREEIGGANEYKREIRSLSPYQIRNLSGLLLSFSFSEKLSAMTSNEDSENLRFSITLKITSLKQQ